MKSIKQGRGPSAMGGIAAILAAIFGVFWCVLAVAMGAVFMVPFGIIFIVMAICSAIYSFHNTTSKNRYSILDIVDDDEEPDPLNQKYGKKPEETIDSNDDLGTSAGFCPYCGKPVDSGFGFCPKCGKKLPE